MSTRKQNLGDWIRKLREIIFGSTPGIDIDVKESILSDINKLCIEYGRFKSIPFEILKVFVIPNKLREYEKFGLSFTEEQELKTKIEREFAQRFGSTEVPTVEVILCDPREEAPPPVQEGFDDVEMPTDVENRYYLYTSRYEMTAACLHCGYGLVHEDPLDIQDQDHIHIGRGRQVSPKGRRRVNDFAFLNPQNPESKQTKQRLDQATKSEKAALRVIHRDHAEIEQEGHRYHLYPGHPSYRVRIERSNSPLAVTSEGQVLEDGDRILLMPDEEATRLQEHASIDVEIETQEVRDVE